MSGKVIQGFFIGGRIPAAITGALEPAVQGKPVANATRNMVAPCVPDFGGGTRPVQARAAPGRPPFVHGGHASPIQRHGVSDSFAIDPTQIGLARGGGSPLPGPLLAKMGAAFGADFSSVRVHVGPQAARIGAIAFTTGNDLYFAPGHYQADSVRGQQLIGHELAHVIQQRQGRVSAPGSGVAVVQDHALEAEADRLGMRAASGSGARQAATIVQPASASRGTLAAVGALGLGYAAYHAYSYLTATPAYPNRVPQDYVREVATYLAGWRSTRGTPANMQVFRETYPGNAAAFRTRVRSGIRFLWTVRTDGVLGIASTTGTQHPIAAAGGDVLAAGEGQLQRAFDNSDMLIPGEAEGLRYLAGELRRKAWRKLVARRLGQPDPEPFASIKDLLENARAKDQTANELVGGAHPAAAQPAPGNDIVYLNLHSGHYHPELSGRMLSSRAWRSADAAWRGAGFTPRRERGSAYV